MPICLIGSARLCRGLCPSQRRLAGHSISKGDPCRGPGKGPTSLLGQSNRFRNGAGAGAPVREESNLNERVPPGAYVAVTTILPDTPTSEKRNMRRKSMPAELNTALQTNEGRAAIQELLKGEPGAGVKKQMVFGNYFGSSSAKSPTAAVPPMDVPRSTEPRPLKSSSPDEYKKTASARLAKQDEPDPPRPQAQSSANSSYVTSLASLGPRGDASKLSPAKGEEDPAPRQKDEIKMLAVSKNLPVSMARTSWALSDFCIGRKMYTGYASTVYQATCRKSLEQVALKIYHMENLCELNHFQVLREVRVHSSLNHQNIVHLFAAFQEGHYVVMVQEYAAGGDLYRLLHKNGGRLVERQAVEMVLHPFLLALHYLHTRGIMHRDIKPENVLFTEHRVLKLADFGLAIDLTEERAVTRAGTLDYMAPEVLRCPPKNLPHENKSNTSLHYNNSVDAWAVGVFAYELVVGFPPFAGDTQLDSVDRIMHSTPDFPEKVTELAKAFICQALKKHPGDRPTVMEMIHHPWIRTYQRRTSMLHIPPAARRRNSSVTYTSSSAATATVQTDAGAAAGSGPQVGKVAPPSTSTAPATVPEGQPSPTKAPEDMSPDDIEEMIQKLQLAKQQALDRVGNRSGNLSVSSSPSNIVSKS
eukprot:gene5562-4199_t